LTCKVDLYHEVTFGGSEPLQNNESGYSRPSLHLTFQGTPAVGIEDQSNVTSSSANPPVTPYFSYTGDARQRFSTRGTVSGTSATRSSPASTSALRSITSPIYEPLDLSNDSGGESGGAADSGESSEDE
jgi:hypothetical protein